MSIWSWLKLTAAQWLIRNGFKAFGWLPATAAAIATWPLARSYGQFGWRLWF